MSSRVIITFQNAKASIAYSKAKVSLSYVDAKMVDVILDPYTLNRWFDEDDDIFSITDSFSFLYIPLNWLALLQSSH